MARPARFFWLATMLVFLSGCTSHRYASLPKSQGDPGDRIVVKPGSKAKLVLTSGEKMSGEVLRATRDELVLGRPGNYGIDEQSFPANDIAPIEVEYTSSGDKVVVYSAIGIAALAVIAAASFGDGLAEGLGGLN